VKNPDGTADGGRARAVHITGRTGANVSPRALIPAMLLRGVARCCPRSPHRICSIRPAPKTGVGMRKIR